MRGDVDEDRKVRKWGGSRSVAGGGAARRAAGRAEEAVGWRGEDEVGEGRARQRGRRPGAMKTRSEKEKHDEKV
jgi:hypothetical protein